MKNSNTWQATAIPTGQSGDVKITRRIITWDDVQAQIMSYQHHPVGPGTVLTRLIMGKHMMMADTHWEQDTARRFLAAAKGDVLVFGLGLGCVLRVLRDRKDIRSITCVEKSRDVLKLVAPHCRHPKVTIVEGDAFTYEPTMQYDAIWIDIWHAASNRFTGERRSLVGRYRKWKRAGGFLGTWRMAWA